MGGISMSGFSPGPDVTDAGPVLVEIGQPEGRRRWSVVGAGRVLAVFVDPATGDVVVTDGRCPHAGAPMQDGWFHLGSVVCPFHRYLFDPQTGRCRNSARYRLPVYPTVVRDGRVYADVPFNPLGPAIYPEGRREQREDAVSAD
jgi:nitrite reductase (NADH) small subunit